MITLCCLITLLLCNMATTSYALTYRFYHITHNNAGDASIGEDQLSFELTGYGNDQMLFIFNNSGPSASSITDIYFDDDTPLLSYKNFFGSTGVGYTIGAKPENLPGGETYSFTANYSYDSDSPVQPNGINPGESLGILFDYVEDFSYDEIISALADKNLRIGIHVQGFASGGSESFINSPSHAPEPATMLLLGFGLMGLAGMGRRTIKK